jgi:ABC-type bacteriocin/lantibiotic exporter with double-glycine peptidase domain
VELRILESIQQRIFTYVGLEFAFRFPRIKIEEIMNINARDLANRFFDSIVLEKSFIKLLTDFSIITFQILISAIVLCFYHSSFLILNLFVVIVLYFGFRYTFHKALNAGLEYSRYKYKTAYWIEEVANASSTFKLAGKTELPLSKIDEYLLNYLSKREYYYKWINVQYVILNISKIIYVLGFLLIGGIMVMEQKMNIGQFVASEVLIITIINGLDKIIHTLKNFYDTLISLEKLAEVTDLILEKNKSGSLYSSSEGGMSISIRHLNFKYPLSEKNVLHDINLDIISGEKVLITGKNNSGKTTLLKIISSLYEISDGDIIYNEISIKNIDKERLRFDIGIYFQEDVIFNGTIMDNITLGRDGIDTKFIEEISNLINLSSYLETLRDGYYTELNAHGYGLPLSVIYKILFLRVIATKPRLLLIENMHLNFFNEDREKFVQIITDKKYPWTLICIDEMDNLTKFYDTIYVLDNGRIIEKKQINQIK